MTRSRNFLRVLRILVLGLLTASSASAVPLGKGILVLDSQGDAMNNVTCLSATYDNVTYDVFGTNVNLSTEIGSAFCTGSTVGGVLQPAHCESYPDNSILVADVPATVVCLDPPNCLNGSFVSETFSFTGSLATTIGSDVVYTSDGTTSFAGILGSTSIPGCTLVGSVAHFTGATGLNAFQTQPTSTGANQTVTFPETTFFNPLTGLEQPVDLNVTFSDVSSGGTTSVTATSNAAGTIPSNFAFDVNGYHAAFLDIMTTATITPPIVVCSSYDDVDDDGFLDGTSPPVPETALQFMHGEDGAFVDRTSSRDPVGNIICGTTDHLSPFVVLVRTSEICAAANAPCDDGDVCTANICDSGLHCVVTGPTDCDDGTACTTDTCSSPTGCVHTMVVASGCNTTNAKASLQIKNSAVASKDQIKFQWQSGSIPLDDFGTPTGSNAYTFCVFDQDQVIASAVAPAGSMCGSVPCWTESTKGVKYADKSKPSAHDGVKQLTGTPSTDGKAKLQLKLGGETLPSINLPDVDYPVLVQLQTSDGECWEQTFSSADEKALDASQLKLSHKAP